MDAVRAPPAMDNHFVESLAPTGIASNHDALAQLLIGRHFLLLASLQWLRLDGKCGSSGAV
jgi:hypothetical protein